MHAQQQAGSFSDGIFVVGDASAIGCSHFPQDGIRFRHDIRDAKRSSDFNQFTSGNNYLAVFCQRIECKQDRGGIVVDYDGGDGGLQRYGRGRPRLHDPLSRSFWNRRLTWRRAYRARLFPDLTQDWNTIPRSRERALMLEAKLARAPNLYAE